ncbi:iron chaperone [Foetidibacter luteolus]|uniref:iron chaperone n=1 Tax=Foetidibacter luteolus TaxID=2608880 RepID=UPI00129BF988|nr:DUF1801 domain-containing protein [Foetidibacter luteolus]
MAKTDYKTIDQYHQAFPADIVQRMQIIREIIHQVVPGVKETISYQVPCFKYHGYLIYYCAFTKHITISNPYSAAFWEHFKLDLEGYKVSKSAIQLPNDQPLPEKLIKKIIEFRKKENVAAAKTKKAG